MEALRALAWYAAKRSSVASASASPSVRGRGVAAGTHSGSPAARLWR